MIGPFNTEKRVVESITIAHTSMVSPEHLGFSVSDDIIAPRSGIPVRPLQPADAAEPAEQPDVDVIPAAETQSPQSKQEKMAWSTMKFGLMVLDSTPIHL